MEELETYIEFTFEAAHITPPFPHPHGHSFRVKVSFRGQPDPYYGWSHDLRDVEPVIERVRGEVDHKFLNDVPGLEMPTLENVTRWLWHRLHGEIEGLDRVTVSRGGSGVSEGCTYRSLAPALTRPGRAAPALPVEA